ncbi:LLM class flavin-dependent oxidoreductase [Parafrankia sp. FMc2]|uniref:LLM class flavin-dependent oxidoreductase n=1 Tax=Parafrankia sp. FMc2 TaxID=3233196 RepID=UPI0034D632DA
MKVGLYLDLRNPPRWRQDPARLYSFTLELVEEAERAGIDSIWTSEHHLFADDYLSAPLTFLAAVAARTRRVRLGTAIVVAPLHHPAELAEQAAVIDLISDGRLDLGLGAGYRVPEFELFGASLERRYGQTDEVARKVRALLSPGGVRPQPVQSRLPIWMGYQGLKGARRAGLLGEGLLTADARSWAPYREGLVEAGHDPEIGRMTGLINAFVSDDPDRDWELVKDRLAYQLDSYNEHAVEGTGRPVPAPRDPERLRGRDSSLLNYFWCDTGAVVAERVRAFTSGAPVETVFMFVSLAGLPEEMVVRHMETICRDLVPLLAPVDARGGSESRQGASSPM